MNVSIRTTRTICTECSKIVPSQPREPITLTPSSDWLFQQIVMDLFHVGNQTYLACADRLTGWLIIHHLNHRQANTSRLISICRDIFQTYIAPEELSSNGGLPFASSMFTQFLKDWTVKHRLSSAAYPRCNGYRRRKWTRRHEFKSWTRLIAFHIALMPLGKVRIQLFSLQLWVNSRADCVLQPWRGN